MAQQEVRRARQQAADVSVDEGSGSDLAPIQQGGVLADMTRGEVDIQIATAKTYPRALATFEKRAMTIACRSQDIAQACYYVLKRKDKDGSIKLIKGPSVRLAEIVAGTYQNLRVASRYIGEYDNCVVCEGACFDLENNVAMSASARARITYRDGGRFNDDLIQLTVMRCMSIALRNAIFKVVPMALVEQVYQSCIRTAVGDTKTLNERRDKAVDHFGKLGIDKSQLLKLLGLKGWADFDLDALEKLIGLHTAIDTGETTVDELLRDINSARETASIDVSATLGKATETTTQPGGSAATAPKPKAKKAEPAPAEPLLATPAPEEPAPEPEPEPEPAKAEPEEPEAAPAEEPPPPAAEPEPVDPAMIVRAAWGKRFWEIHGSDPTPELIDAQLNDFCLNHWAKQPFAAIAEKHPDWLDGRPTHLLGFILAGKIKPERFNFGLEDAPTGSDDVPPEEPTRPGKRK